MIMNLAEQIRLRLINKHPYFANIFEKVYFIESPKLKYYAACDRYWRVYYNPNKLSKCSSGEQEMVFLHEVIGHLVGEHFRRGEEWLKNPQNQLENWKIGAEYEINGHYYKKGPQDLYYPQKDNLEPGLLAEKYAQLLNNQKVNQSKEIHNSCGSGAGDLPGEWELGEPDARNPGLDPIEARVIIENTLEGLDLSQKSIGSLAGHLERIVERIKISKQIPWQNELFKEILGTISFHGRIPARSYRRENRYSEEIYPLILPGKLKREPTIAIISDTSGSINDHELGIFKEQNQKILNLTGSHAWILAGDTETEPILTRNLDKVKFNGRGGTNMGKLVEIADSLNPHPSVIVVFTDGRTPWGNKPNAKTIVACTTNASVPNWAKRIQIKE